MTPFARPKNHAKSLADARQHHADLVAEAEEIVSLTEKEGRNPTAEENARFKAITEAEVPAARRAIALAEAKLDAQKDAVLSQLRSQHDANARDDESPMLFRDASTGREIRALRPDERMSDYVGLRGEGDQFDGAAIDDGSDESRRRQVRGNLPRPGELLRSMATSSPLPDGRTVQAALGGVDQEGGFMLNPTISPMFIDLARANAVAFDAGARTLPMTTRETNIIRATKGYDAHWRAEGTKVPASNALFGMFMLRLKTCAARLAVSIEWLEDAPNAASVIQAMLGASMGLELDRAILSGVGAENQPLGIRNTPGVNAIGSVGTPANYSQVSSAVGQILNANFPNDPSSLAWVRSPREGESYDGLTATDGQPLQPTPWAGALKRFATTSLETDGGAGSNEAEMIVGDFSQCLVGMRSDGVNIRVLEAGEAIDGNGEPIDAASSLMRVIVAYFRADVCLLRPDWFTVLSGVTAD